MQPLVKPGGNLIWSPIRYRHMGGHSGMCGLLPAFRRASGLEPLVVPMFETRSAWQRLKRRVTRSGPARFAQARREEWILRQLKGAPGRTLFLESIEDHLPLLAKESLWRARPRVVGISHQPPSWWQMVGRDARSIARFDHVLALSRQSMEFWKQHLAPERVVFLPHGVESEFFAPAQGETSDTFRALFVGAWLRDFETLVSIIQECARRRLKISFDLVIPIGGQTEKLLGALAVGPQVRLHHSVPDEELRGFYQEADLLVLPLIDCTANNAILEAMACALPIAVTDAGGVRDYTDPAFAALLPPGAAGEWIEVLLHARENREELRARGQRAREYAVSRFQWSRAAATVNEVLGKRA